MNSILLTHFATRAACTLNGQSVSCGKVTTTAAGVFGALFLVLGVVILVGVIGLIFWILSLIHVIQHSDVRNRLVWLIVTLIVPFGAVAYFFVVLIPYNKAHPYIAKPHGTNS